MLHLKLSSSAPVKRPEETLKESALMLVVSSNNKCNNSKSEWGKAGTQRERQKKDMLKGDEMQNQPFETVSTCLFDSLQINTFNLIVC